MGVLEELIWVLGWTEGRGGQRFKRVNQEKKRVYGKLNR